MKTVRDACVLQDNALSITISDQIEQLDELITTEGDGMAFFEKTHITGGMRDLLGGGIARLAGKSSNAVFHLKQAMGGGKTHLLVGMGLVARSDKLRASRCSDIPYQDAFTSARVVAFNGRNNPPHYIWGEVAKQLDQAGKFTDYWMNGPKAPDEKAWTDLLKSDSPTLILLDEMPPYFQYYGTQTVGQGTVADIVTRAFANMLSAAGKLSNVCVVVSDLDAAYGEGGAMIQRALADARKELGRQEKTITPVDLAGNEVYDILRKRLFKKLPDTAVIDDVASKFGAALAEAAKSKTISRGAEAIADEISSTYPFHPRLKDLVALFKENEQFKQTRGLMELVSRLLRSVWERDANDVYLVGAQHFDLGIADVREKLAEVSGMRDVISRDLWDANSGAHAQVIDAHTGNKATSEVGNLLLTASLSTAVNAVKGLSREEILECVVTPVQGVEDYSAAFDALRGEAWYLHHNQDNKFYFDRQENLTKLLQSLAQEAPENKVDELVKKRLEDMFAPVRKSAYTKVVALPKLAEVADEVRRNRVLLIVDPDSKLPPAAVLEFFQSLSEQNNILVLTGDKTQMASVDAAARKVFAAIKADTRIPKQHVQREDYEAKHQQYEQDFTSTLLNIFDKVMFPVQLGDKSAELRSKPLDMKRDAKLPFNGEEQIEKTLTSQPKKLHLDVEADFDALRSKAEDLLWPQGQVDARWADVADRAQQKAAMPWMPPKGLDTLKTTAVNRGAWEDLGTGWVTKAPAKKKTDVQVSQESDPDDAGNVRLRVTAVNAGPAARVHYAEDGVVTTSSPVLEEDVLTTNALRVQFMAVDPTDQYEMGDPFKWTTKPKLRANLAASGGKRVVELKVAPSGSIKYSLDGREPRNGDAYAGPIEIGNAAVQVLAFAEADGIEAKESFSFPAAGVEGPTIDPFKPAVLTGAGGGKKLTTRKQAFGAVTFSKERGVKFEKLSVIVGQGAKTVTFMAGDVELTADFLETTLNNLAGLLDPEAPVVVTLGKTKFANGHDLKEFLEQTGLTVNPTEVSQ
ncbi:anti-phage-associated DUF499 domain-containing protein [Variovorax sp. J31P207]|uniref:anti-phage-associated DUF499 domain-containing protein n=1 Tax=Variovorax sp. J31P207 TaxID=3053510 RepID=UPI0025772962|nr:anti-phage-associated DUF499 domain-containing protein [Variovorax sp. J31P207]MDM0068790.1 DUF499 domain-containing protein [Variovorax sp. J31P207]